MAQLVQELLSLSRLETAARQIMPAKLDTEAFLWEVYETWQPVAAKAGDRLTLRLPDGALPPIRADEDALKQVMAILLSNAVQHTPAVRRSNFPPWRQGERSACRWPIRGRALRIRNGLSKVLSRRPANRRCQPGSGPEHRAEAWRCITAASRSGIRRAAALRCRSRSHRRDIGRIHNRLSHHCKKCCESLLVSHSTF